MQLGAWCALFALAIQFAVSFGHAHSAELGSSVGPLSLTAPSGHGPPEVPAKLPGTASDLCAICAVTNLAANALPAAAPGLPVPISVNPIAFRPVFEASAVASPHRLFRARAPPLA